MSASTARTVSARALQQLRPVELCAIAPSGRIEFRIQRALKNYNSANRNPHWSKKHKTLKIWLTSLTNAMVLSLGYNAARDLLVPESGLFGARGVRCEERRRVEITRIVPSKRNLIRDTFDNLPWTAKELRDAIKHTGLIYDDSTEWTDTVITQDVSLDKTFWTWIAIDKTAK